MTARVAQLQPLIHATTQLSIASATVAATPRAGASLVSPISGRELRAQLRAQQPRNSPAQKRNNGPERVSEVAGSYAAELRRLIWLILANDSAADRAEALAVALGDPEAAQTSFRALIAVATTMEKQRGDSSETGGIQGDHSETMPKQWEPAADSGEHAQDERRTCRQCANLNNRGQCLAAWRGEAKSWPWFAPQTYHPVADLPQCCPSLRPLAADADQRTGAARWPNLAREQRT